MVEWSIPARNDLKQIHDFIARDSKYYADKVTNTIVERTEMLNEFPEIGRVVQEIGDKNVREIIEYSYRIIYEVYGERIEILALVHGRSIMTPEI
ncbi:type II toxin-antitoxin system RelE/ParE family toxin [Spirochaetota bacterium]